MWEYNQGGGGDAGKIILIFKACFSVLHLHKCNLPLSIIGCCVKLPVHREEITIIAFIWEGIQECLFTLLPFIKHLKQLFC